MFAFLGYQFTHITLCRIVTPFLSIFDEWMNEWRLTYADYDAFNLLVDVVWSLLSPKKYSPRMSPVDGHYRNIFYDEDSTSTA